VSIEESAEFLSAYQDYVRGTLAPTRTKIKELFKSWKEPTYWARPTSHNRLPSPSPIQRAFPRIKRPESVVDKILRKPTSYPDGLSINSVKIMNDAIAARIVVYFLSNLPLIDRELRESDLIEISSEEPPIAYLGSDLARRIGLGDLLIGEKVSGYASVHYIVRFRSPEGPEVIQPWFEIQIRTLAEDVWSEIEHVLGYKPEKRTSLAVRKQFQILSSQLTSIDEHFNLLFEELTRFQEEGDYADDSLLNAENLPPVLIDLGMGCAQKEIDGLLKLLASRGFLTVGDLRAGASGHRIEIVRNVFRNSEGREPGNFEIVAGIAAIRGVSDEEKIAALVRGQIAFLAAWLDLRDEFP